MKDPAAESETFFEVVGSLQQFNDLRDPRQRGKIISLLDEILLLTRLAGLAGAHPFVELARRSDKKLDLSRRLLSFEDGTPSRGDLGGIFAALDTEQFQHCFVARVASVTGLPEGVVAIDASTGRRSGGRASAGTIHIVPAFAVRRCDQSNHEQHANTAGARLDGKRIPIVPVADERPSVLEAGSCTGGRYWDNVLIHDIHNQNSFRSRVFRESSIISSTKHMPRNKIRSRGAISILSHTQAATGLEGVGCPIACMAGTTCVEVR